MSTAHSYVRLCELTVVAVLIQEFCVIPGGGWRR